jgi:hypothetical protein
MAKGSRILLYIRRLQIVSVAPFSVMWHTVIIRQLIIVLDQEVAVSVKLNHSFSVTSRQHIIDLRSTVPNYPILRNSVLRLYQGTCECPWSRWRAGGNMCQLSAWFWTHPGHLDFDCLSTLTPVSSEETEVEQYSVDLWRLGKPVNPLNGWNSLTCFLTSLIHSKYVKIHVWGSCENCPIWHHLSEPPVLIMKIRDNTRSHKWRATG